MRISDWSSDVCSSDLDQFQGDSLWRLGTSLNYLARQLAALGRLDDAEVIVADWDSTETLRDATVLTEEARRIVRFLTVPPELAKGQQKGHPRSEERRGGTEWGRTGRSRGWPSQ